MSAHPPETLVPLREPRVSSLEEEFRPFRERIVGHDRTFRSPYGERRIVYADWTASGRLYRPIEERLLDTFGPFVGNTHSESSATGACMTLAYEHARRVIKRHVNADEHDVLLTAGFGMTAAVNKLQRILGLRVPERMRPHLRLPEAERPVVFITHMEHHSNQTSWLETVAEVVCVDPDESGRVSPERLEEALRRHPGPALKIGAFTACSNVTGIDTPYHRLARVMHEHGGLCFVDFAASAPYVRIDMHPADPLEKLDAVLFSPHKFLGGPGSSGVLVFDSRLYTNAVPDHPGGGTVAWTNPWGGHRYLDEVEQREDGGTPGFLQAIRTALCIGVKEEMGVERMAARERELVRTALSGLRAIPGVHLLAENAEERLGILSFYTEGVHYNLMVKVLNDVFGIQARGGCSCAGTYGHYLLHVDPGRSRRITDLIDRGDLSEKPGWVRLSLHPTTTGAELDAILEAVHAVATDPDRWADDYRYSPTCNEFAHHRGQFPTREEVQGWFAPLTPRTD